MDILFDDTSTKKRTKKAGPLAAKSSGFSKSKDAKPALNLFGGDDLFSQKPKEKANKNEEKTAKAPPVIPKSEQDPKIVLEKFLGEHPEIEPFIRIQDFTEIGYSKEQLHKKVSSLAAESFVRIAQCSPIIVSTTGEVEKLFAGIHAKYEKLPLKFGDSFKRRALYYLTYNMRLKRVSLVKKNLDRVSECILFIGNLVNIFSKYLVEKELKILVPQIEAAITEFPVKDKEFNKITQILKIVDNMLNEPEYVDCSFAAINAIVQKCYNPSAGYFPDLGQAENLFEISLESLPQDLKGMLTKRINITRERPNAIGKAILAESNDYMKHYGLDPNQTMQIVFIFFARYFFAQLYKSSISNNILTANNSLFIERIIRLRKLSPIGFGFSGNFLPEQLKSIPLDHFPNVNPYKEAVGCFELLQFQICPLDFCKSIHDALKLIQAVASDISFQTKTDANGGKIYAKSDHLLCLDDLFDISLIVLILAAPVALQAMVEQFEPFIQSLEMTAELEFSFTNISAMVRHILELDIDSFVADAQHRTSQALEIDPLRILS